MRWRRSSIARSSANWKRRAARVEMRASRHSEGWEKRLDATILALAAAGRNTRSAMGRSSNDRIYIVQTVNAVVHAIVDETLQRVFCGGRSFLRLGCTDDACVAPVGRPDAYQSLFFVGRYGP